MVEPAIPTPAGVRRPDLLLYHPTKRAHVIDATVVADNADLCAMHRRKCEYYDTPEIRQWVHETTNTDHVSFSSVTLNWRGLLAVPSAETLYQELGLNTSLLSLLSQVTLERGLWIHQHHRESTFRVRAL